MDFQNGDIVLWMKFFRKGKCQLPGDGSDRSEKRRPICRQVVTEDCPVGESGCVDATQVDPVGQFYVFENLIHESDIIDPLEVGLGLLVLAAIIPISIEGLGKKGDKMAGFGDSVKVGEINNRCSAPTWLLGAVENEDESESSPRGGSAQTFERCGLAPKASECCRQKFQLLASLD